MEFNYERINSRKTVSHSNGLFDLDIIGYANLFLILAVIISAITYIVWANAIAIQSYRLTSLHEELSKVNESHSSLASQASYDPSRLKDFAALQGMIEARNVGYIFDSRAVALEERNGI